MSIQIERSACFTGHRVLKSDFDIESVEEIILDLIKEGYEFFFNGMAIGFDLCVMESLVKIRKKYPYIKIVACVPCNNQEKNFSISQKIRYKELLESANLVVKVSEEYTPECMKKRDRFMVDNCSVCVSYLYKAQGGSYYTTKYALEKNRRIIYVK